MPGLNGRGPEGSGSMTGRALGRCAGSTGGENMFLGRRGLGRQQRGGMSFRRGRFFSGNIMTKEQEVDSLKREAEFLKQQLLDVQNQVEDLEGQK